MKPLFPLVLLTVVALASNLRPGLAAEPERPAPAGMEWWRLRSTDVLTTGSTSPAATKTPPVTEIPEARRSVRVVYPGLSGGR